MFETGKETIAAIATPAGYGGIGIVRISGPAAADIARKIFIPSDERLRMNPDQASGQREALSLPPRRLCHGYFSAFPSNSVLDEVLLVYMPAPNSYTAENVIEIQAHGGRIGLDAILEVVLRSGARLAEPGEFTRRAYLNGRIDLSQAEAVIDLIQAKSDAAMRMASRSLNGGIREKVQRIRNAIIDLKVLVEACIDFPDDVEDILTPQILIPRIERDMHAPLISMINTFETGQALREGVRLAILGRANVGKSSLLNRMLQRERAIVTEHPGTTRDSIEEMIVLRGLPVVLIDTAGLRRSDDPVEKIGMERTRDIAASADLVLFMIDASDGVLAEDKKIYREIHAKSTLLVVNKTDLVTEAERIRIPRGWDFHEKVYTSVKFEAGVDELKQKIYNFATKGKSIEEGDLVPNIRQRRLLEKAKDAIVVAMRGIDGNVPAEMIALDLKEAIDGLDDILGTTARVDVLNEIFDRFCIGK